MHLEHSSYLIPYHNFHGILCWHLFRGVQQQEVVGWRFGDAESKAGGVSGEMGPHPLQSQGDLAHMCFLNTVCAISKLPFSGLFVLPTLTGRLIPGSQCLVESLDPKGVFYS